MIDLKNYYLFGSIYINYREGLKGSILLEDENGVIPIELKEEDLTFISFYPNIMKKLIDGKELYLKAFNGYLGTEETMGPYCEQKIFVSEYDDENASLSELIINLENKIEKGKSNVRKLSKIGIYYSE